MSRYEESLHGPPRRARGIIIGTRGMGSVGNLLMGSIATKVVHLAPVPATLVK